MLVRNTHFLQRRWSLVCPWLKRIGLYGVGFFLLKGLLWLVLPAVLTYWGLRG